jgi:hypothetical protein
LQARDATARPLHSWLVLRRREILIRVDARGARYPLRIDPLVQQGGKLTPENEQAPVFFGASAAISADGKTALVGAPRKSGAAWVFTHSGSAWQRGQVLHGPQEKGLSEAGFPCEVEAGGEEGEDDSGCGFGASVAVSADGKTALIGSPREKRACASGPECPYQGAAWVFVRSGEAWAKQGELPLLGREEESAGGRFGRSVALSADGNTALVVQPLGRELDAGPEARGKRGGWSGALRREHCAVIERRRRAHRRFSRQRSTRRRVVIHTRGSHMGVR